MATETKKPKLPTPEQIKAYAAKLPEIYRETLITLQKMTPNRIAGENFHIQNWNDLTRNYSIGEVRKAIDELEQGGFLSFEDSLSFIDLTDLGEELMAAVTGKRPKSIPKLPDPEW